MHSKTVVLLLLLLSVASWSPPGVHGGRWFLTFQTANNWMAGYVGDVMVCFHFRPLAVRLHVNATAEEFDFANRTLIDNMFIDDEDATDNRTEDCQTIPWRSFERGKTYVFGMDFIKNAELEKVHLFTKLDNSSLCKRKTLDAWHVENVSFQNRLTGKFFQKLELDVTESSLSTSKSPKTPKKSGGKKSFDIPKSDDVLLIGPKCNAGKGELILNNFNVSVRPRPCEFSGAIYQDGEPFEDGCVGVCKCRDGGVSCVSRCVPFIAPGCRHVHVPNECCQDVICDTKLQHITCPVYEENDCETANRTITPGEFPWTVFVKLCDKKGCKGYCSGALLTDQWILSASDCLVWANGKLANADQIRVIIGESTLFLAEDRDIELAVESVALKPGGEGAALIKLKERVMFDKIVQPALLPHSKDHCHQLLQPYCGITLTGWMNVGPPETEQYELYKLNTRLEDSSVCPPPLMTTTTTAAPPSSRRRKPPPPIRHRLEMPLCINMGNDEPELSIDCGTCQPDNDLAYTCVSDKNTHLCSGEKGRTIVSRVQIPQSIADGDFRDVDILVGVVTYEEADNNNTAAIGSSCRNRAHWLGVGICHDLNWIMSTTST